MTLQSLMADLRATHRCPTQEECDLIEREGDFDDVRDAALYSGYLHRGLKRRYVRESKACREPVR